MPRRRARRPCKTVPSARATGSRRRRRCDAGQRAIAAGSAARRAGQAREPSARDREGVRGPPFGIVRESSPRIGGDSTARSAPARLRALPGGDCAGRCSRTSDGAPGSGRARNRSAGWSAVPRERSGDGPVRGTARHGAEATRPEPLVKVPAPSGAARGRAGVVSSFCAPLPWLAWRRCSRSRARPRTPSGASRPPAAARFAAGADAPLLDAAGGPEGHDGSEHGGA